MSYDEETEAETIADRIRPELEAAGWGKVPGSRIRAEKICPGRILLGGGNGKNLSCDLVLEYKGQYLGALEAKRASISHRNGVGQAKEYAQRLGARFGFASNGLQWRKMDMETGQEADFSPPFPSPDDLWQAQFGDDAQAEWRHRFGDVAFESPGGRWLPRYYQHRAIDAALSAIGAGKPRVLLTLATGTGKTAIAFQIAWKLYQTKWNTDGMGERHPRILFLADRNVLANQALNEFDPFPQDIIARIDTETLRKRGVPQNHNIFFTIFQTMKPSDEEPLYKKYPSDFFDLIFIDECHRGAARNESQWREMLTYFEPATQIGLTATPRRDENADTYDYFGEPVYSYSLKQGIADGYLTPYKVRILRSSMTQYVHSEEHTVVSGEAPEVGESFSEESYNRRIVLRELERKHVQTLLAQMDQSQKTIVFCEDQEHALLIRDLINEEKDSEETNYCQCVTHGEGSRGDQYLNEFQDNEKTVPTILTTSQKLSTGVNAKNVRNIVLLRNINSMIEFKQIIGRGTRLFDGKEYFTIWDFFNAHQKFGDPEWDGEPLEPPEIISQPDELPDSEDASPEEAGKQKREKTHIELADGTVRAIQYIEASIYLDAFGNQMTAHEFIENIFGAMPASVVDEESLRAMWRHPDQREKLLGQLADSGFSKDELEELRKLVDAPDSDLFDVLAYVRFDLPLITRRRRSEQAHISDLGGSNEEMQQFLYDVLQSYVVSGHEELGADRLDKLVQARYASVTEGITQLGGDHQLINQVFLKLQERLYQNGH